jgi:hypothetical protein
MVSELWASFSILTRSLMQVYSTTCLVSAETSTTSSYAHAAFTQSKQTRTKPAKSRAVVTVHDGRLLVNGNAPDRDPLIQAKACASDLTRLLEQSTGKRFAIQPVVVFPGWFVEDERTSKSPVWVLEPKALPSWIRNNAAILSGSDVCLATYHLSRHIRTAAP